MRVWLVDLQSAERHARRARAGTALQSILGGELGVARSAVKLARQPDGRPVLADGPLAFSLSHAGGWAAIAVADEHFARVGVDIEARERRVSRALIARYLSAAEAAGLSELDARARGEAFLGLWTAKEACAKLLDGGLGANLSRLELRGAGTPPAVADDRLGQGLRLSDRQLAAAIVLHAPLQTPSALTGALAVLRRGHLPAGQAGRS